MKIQYFQKCENFTEIKQQYKELVKKYHPDLNGIDGLEITKIINLEYTFIKEYFEKNQNLPFFEFNNENYTQFDSLSNETKLKINNIIHLNLVIEIVGSWVWISGNTYPYREILKENKFYFSGAKKMWYFAENEKKQRASNLSMDEIKSKYGSSKVENKYNYRIA